MNRRTVPVLLLLILVALAGMLAAPAYSQDATDATPGATGTVTETVTGTAGATGTVAATGTPTAVPEFPTVVIPVAAVLGLVMLLLYERRGK